MEHVVRAPVTGTVIAWPSVPGTVVGDRGPAGRGRGGRGGRRDPGPSERRGHSTSTPSAPIWPRSSDRQARILDAGRPEVVARRHGQGRRTARENIDDLCDPGSFIEYGSLGHRRPAGPPTGRGADRAHAGRRAGGRHRPGQRRPVRRPARRRARSCPTTTRCWPAPRASRTTARRTGCSSWSSGCGCRWCCSPKAAAAGPGDTDYAVVTGLDTPAFALFGAAQRPGPAGRASPRAAASPATPPCSAAAT